MSMKMRVAHKFKLLLVGIVNQLLTIPSAARSLVVSISRELLPKRVRKFGNRILENPNHRPRRYLSSRYDLPQFFLELKRRKVSYVVLRWFEELPQIEEGEDVDILIADSSLELIDDMFVNDSRNQALDIYSSSGLAGSNFRGVPYYKPELAQQILAGREWQKELYAVPSRNEHFLSLAYHLLFHKGELSSDHDYIKKLESLAPDGRTEICDSFDTIYEYLKSRSWIPELDTQRKLAAGSPWLSSRLQKPGGANTGGELMVFVVREWAASDARMSVILDLLKRTPLEILHIWPLDSKRQELANALIRGGKWDEGEYRATGGKPAIFVVCFDYHPGAPSAEVQKKFPYLENANYLVKHKIRDKLNAGHLLHRQANSIHASDDETEAYHYVKSVFPERLSALSEASDIRKSSYQTHHPVVKLLSTHRTRAKVEIINFENALAVKKTFKQNQQEFLDREIFVHGQLSKKLKYIPPLTKRGENFLIIPWYENVLAEMGEQDRNGILRASGSVIVDILRFFYNEGYALIDFHPGNLLLSPDMDLKVIDFEFLYRYKVKPDSFDKSYDIAGVPEDFEGDLPSGHKGYGRTFNNTWKPVIGHLGQFT